jgi:hypothetical protein
LVCKSFKIGADLAMVEKFEALAEQEIAKQFLGSKLTWDPLLEPINAKMKTVQDKVDAVSSLLVLPRCIVIDEEQFRHFSELATGSCMMDCLIHVKPMANIGDRPIDLFQMFSPVLDDTEFVRTAREEVRRSLFEEAAKDGKKAVEKVQKELAMLSHQIIELEHMRHQWSSTITFLVHEKTFDLYLQKVRSLLMGFQVPDETIKTIQEQVNQDIQLVKTSWNPAAGLFEREFTLTRQNVMEALERAGIEGSDKLVCLIQEAKEGIREADEFDVLMAKTRLLRFSEVSWQVSQWLEEAVDSGIFLQFEKLPFVPRELRGKRNVTVGSLLVL